MFTEAVQAAPALTEEGTRLADANHGVSDETWAQVRKRYDDDQIAALVALVEALHVLRPRRRGVQAIVRAVTDLFAETETDSTPAGPLPHVEIYTDGACKRNPDGPGGWGAVLSSGSHRKELHGGSPSTTNNRMELTAVIEALTALKVPSEVELFTDSEYVRRGITEWIHNWKNRGWKTTDKKPVKNVDLWQALDAARRRHRIEWRWVKGHSGDPGNERADALANLGAAEHA